MSDTTDLPDWITVGAKAAEASSRSGRGYDIAIVTVKHITATTVVCTGHPYLAETQYRRNDLHRVGEGYGPQLMRLDAPAVRAGLARAGVENVVSRSERVVRDCGYDEENYRAALDEIAALVADTYARLGWLKVSRTVPPNAAGITGHLESCGCLTNKAGAHRKGCPDHPDGLAPWRPGQRDTRGTAMSDYPPATPGRCGWIVGTIYTGPQRCGRPAKATVNVHTGDIPVPEVCGIHLRSVRRERYYIDQFTRDGRPTP